MSTKQYIGDSVYIDHDGYYFVVTTENGEGASNTIYFEPQVMADLMVYVQRINLTQCGLLDDGKK